MICVNCYYGIVKVIINTTTSRLTCWVTALGDGPARERLPKPGERLGSTRGLVLIDLDIRRLEILQKYISSTDLSI